MQSVKADAIRSLHSFSSGLGLYNRCRVPLSAAHAALLRVRLWPPLVRWCGGRRLSSQCIHRSSLRSGVYAFSGVPGTPLSDKSFSQRGIVQFEGYRSHRGGIVQFESVSKVTGYVHQLQWDHFLVFLAELAVVLQNEFHQLSAIDV